jgi:hypothetical protein
MSSQTNGHSPRWLYAFFSWISRTPGNGWLLAIIWNVGLALLYQTRAWQLGLLPQGELHPFLLANGYWSTFFIFMLISLDRKAEVALQEFGNSTGMADEEIKATTQQFISVPGKTALNTILIAMLILLPLEYIIYPLAFEGLFSLYPALTVVHLLLINTMLALYFFIRTFRQLGMVRQLYRELPRVSLFYHTPIYSLSRYTGWASFMWLSFAVVGTYLVAPEVVEYNLALAAPFTIFGLLTFFLPLREIQVRLRREKREVQDELNRQLENIFTKTRQVVGQGKSTEVPELEVASKAIQNQLEYVRKMPTWPWNPGTLRNVLIPILIPITVAILQALISRYMGT